MNTDALFDFHAEIEDGVDAETAIETVAADYEIEKVLDIRGNEITVGDTVAIALASDPGMLAVREVVEVLPGGRDNYGDYGADVKIKEAGKHNKYARWSYSNRMVVV